MSTIGVLTTIDTREAASALASAMVEERLAACAQVSAIESHYRWEGQVRKDPEFRILFKTTAARYAELEQAIRTMHSYDLPAIAAFEMTEEFAPYSEWVADNVAPG